MIEATTVISFSRATSIVLWGFRRKNEWFPKLCVLMLWSISPKMIVEMDINVLMIFNPIFDDH